MVLLIDEFIDTLYSISSNSYYSSSLQAHQCQNFNSNPSSDCLNSIYYPFFFPSPLPSPPLSNLPSTISFSPSPSLPLSIHPPLSFQLCLHYHHTEVNEGTSNQTKLLQFNLAQLDPSLTLTLPKPSPFTADRDPKS